MAADEPAPLPLAAALEPEAQPDASEARIIVVSARRVGMGCFIASRRRPDRRGVAQAPKQQARPVDA